MPRLLTLAATLLAVFTLEAAEPSAARFNAGDTICFVGDSITHNGRWHRYVRTFYATRFPTARFTTYNCGISGDTASGALRRFAEDIAIHKPNVAVVMFGMNDVGRNNYGPEKTTPADRAKQDRALTNYTANQEKLATRLKELGARLILVTPSPYDQTGRQADKSLVGVNEALGRCGGIVRDLAGRFQAGLVDFHEPMTRLNLAGQDKDPAFTLIGKDRIHPGDMGHMVMAYQFLTSQGVGATISTMVVDASTATVREAANCTIGIITVTGRSLSFEVQGNALPFPIIGEARKALDLVPLEKDLNQQVLRVAGLPPGSYEVVIDGTVVTSTDASTLANGLNLAMQTTTPDYRQALEVAAACERGATKEAELRTVMAVRHFRLSKDPGLNLNDAAAVERVLAGAEADLRKNNNSYGLWQIDQYRKNHGRLDVMRKEADQEYAAMWAAAVPKPRHYLVRPTTTPGQRP